MLRRIISGGQTGVDIGALVGARRAGMETGGWAPKNYYTEKGPQPRILISFGLRAHPEFGYPVRTYANVRDSSGTLLVNKVNVPSPGTNLTIKFITQLHRPSKMVKFTDSVITDVQSVYDWIIEHNIEVLNVAGHRESSVPGIAEGTAQFIHRLCELFITKPTSSG